MTARPPNPPFETVVHYLAIRKALTHLSHRLTCLHGLQACDGAAPEETWNIDTGVDNRIAEAALELLTEAFGVDKDPQWTDERMSLWMVTPGTDGTQPPKLASSDKGDRP